MDKKCPMVRSFILGVFSTIIYLIMKCCKVSKTKEVNISLNYKFIETSIPVLVMLTMILIVSIVIVMIKENNFQFLLNLLATIGIIFLILPINLLNIFYTIMVAIVAILCLSRFWYIILYNSSTLSNSQVISILALIIPYMYIFLGSQ